MVLHFRRRGVRAGQHWRNRRRRAGEASGAQGAGLATAAAKSAVPG